MRGYNAKTCSGTDKLPIGNYIVMVLMTVVFAVQFLGDQHQIYLTGLILKNASFNAFLGYSWLHTGLIHITSNLILLTIFGRRACVQIGDAKYFLIYIVLGFAAAMAHVLLDGRPVIGASGAITGVLGLAVVLSWRKLSPMGPWLIFIWIAISVAAAIASDAQGAHIAYVAHITGFIMGMILATMLVIFNQVDHGDTDHSLMQIVRPATV